MQRALHLFLRKDTVYTLGIALFWQLSLTLIGWLLSPEQGILGHMSHWDAGWYKHILATAYGPDASPASPAFYPLFPLIIGMLSSVTFTAVPQEVLVLLVNTAALWFALLALVRIGAIFKFTRRAKLVSVLIFLGFPSAFFMHAFYGEALFIALGLWAYLNALQKRWWVTGLLLALLTASRLPSLLFVALCGLEFFQAYGWKMKKIVNRNLLWFLLAPLGLIAYALYLQVARGDFLAMFHAYSATNDWTYQKFNPNIFGTLYETGERVVQSALTLHPTYEVFINYALPLFCIVLIAASAFYLWKKPHGIPLALFGFLSIILFTLNSNVVSVHRYALACLPLFIAAGVLAKHKKAAVTLIILGVLSYGVQLFLYMKFIHDIFAG